MNFIRHPWFVGVLVFWIASIGLARISGPATCRDGWGSSSIGSRGACSWHGGVDRTGDLLIVLASLTVAVGAGTITAKLGRKVGNSKRPRALSAISVDSKHYQMPSRGPAPQAVSPKQEGPACPKCGSPMRRYMSERGETLHWWCSRFPACDGRAEAVAAPASADVVLTGPNRDS